MYSRTSSDAVASAVGRSGEEAALVQAALDHFDFALASHDIGELQAVGIKPVLAKRWQKFFTNNPRANVTDNCPASTLFISGDTATWNCIEMATIISEGKPVQFTHLIRFSFANRNGVWMISDRR